MGSFSDFSVNATDDILIKAYEGQKKIGNIVKMIDDTSERFILISITDIYALEKTTHSIIGKLKVEYNTQKCTKLLKFNIEAKKVECGVFKIIDPYTGEFEYNALNVGEDKIFYSFNDEYGLKKYGLIIIVVVPVGRISTYRNEELLY